MYRVCGLAAVAGGCLLAALLCACIGCVQGLASLQVDSTLCCGVRCTSAYTLCASDCACTYSNMLTILIARDCFSLH